MKPFCLVIFLALASSLPAADLPTVTLEHLYYLQARGERVRKLKPDEMIEYCLAQKIGGSGFEQLYTQISTYRAELTKLIVIGEVSDTDQHVQSIKKYLDAYSRLLQDEVLKVQNGIIREGQIATDALQNIARAQQAAR